MGQGTGTTFRRLAPAASLTRRGRQAGIEPLLFAGFAALFLLFELGRTDSADGHVMFAVAQSVVDHGRVWVDHQVSAVPGVGGHWYSKYGAGLSLLAIIPYALVHPIAAATSNPGAVEEGVVVSLMPLIGALLIVALYRLGRRLGAGPTMSVLVAVGAVLGTFAMPYVREFFSEPLVALLMVVSFERLLARRPATAAAALAAAAVVRPQVFAFAPFLLAVGARQDGLAFTVKRMAFPLLAGLMVSLGWNYLRFHDLTRFGYPGEGFSASSFFSGAGTLLFGARKSIFLFAPIVVLLPAALHHLWGRSRNAFWLLVANAALVFVMAASWSDPPGGWCWGPRLLLVGLLPAVAALAPWLEQCARGWRVAVGVLFAAGFVISSAAVIVPVPMQQLDPGRAHQTSPYVGRQFELIGPTVRYDLGHVGEPRPVNKLGARRLPMTWQFGAGSELGKTAFVASLIPSAVLAGIAGWALLAVRRKLAREPL